VENAKLISLVLDTVSGLQKTLNSAIFILENLKDTMHNELERDRETVVCDISGHIVERVRDAKEWPPTHKWPSEKGDDQC
jgi:hypothetical protein